MRRSPVVMVLLSAALLGPQALGQSAAQPVVVTLQQSATVEEPLVTVAAVARVDGGPLWLRQKIAALDLAEVSAVGRTVAVSRTQVALRLRIAGLDADQFRVEGPAQALVTMAAVELNESEVVKAAEKAVLQRLQANPGEVEFRLADDIRLPAIRINPGDVLRLRGDCLVGTLSAGKTRVTVTVLVNNQPRGVVSVALEMSVYRVVAVTVKTLPTGHIVAAEDVRGERRLVAPGDRSVACNEQLFGHRTLHAVAAGQVLTTADVDLPVSEDQIAVKTRDRVRLLASVGGISIVAAGEALEDGKLGQMVRVRNVDSNKVVTGRVVGHNTVEVEY